MHRFYIETIKYRRNTYYLVRSMDDASIVTEPTKYLKHKVLQHRSSNTVRRLAYSLIYYLNYMEDIGKTIQQVLEMSYTEQHEHFIGFLNWLIQGNHCDRKKIANNNTCNSYLQTVFGYYQFLLLEYDLPGDVKVLERRDIGYNSAVGVQFRRSVQAFQGYLPREESVGKTIEKDKIVTLLENTTSKRTQLMIILLAETGFRIGELLGVRYAEDIDYANKTIRVEYRENNDNGARAKNAEYRRAKISNGAYDFLLLYIAENKELLSRQKYMFITLHGKTKGQHITEYAVYSAFGVLERATGIKCTPHMLRHYYANERREAGWEIDKISAALGHKHIATTERYLHLSDDEMAEAMDKYFAINGGIYNISKLL